MSDRETLLSDVLEQLRVARVATFSAYTMLEAAFHRSTDGRIERLLAEVDASWRTLKTANDLASLESHRARIEMHFRLCPASTPTGAITPRDGDD